MKIKCLAIDDEPLALRQLENYISRVPYLELVKSCQSAAEAGELIDHEHIDAVFCDINMPGLNGMEFVKSLAYPPLIVFTTAYSEYAVEGYKVDAVDYLLKPFSLEEFKGAAEKLRRRMELTRVSAERPATQPSPAEPSYDADHTSGQKIGEDTDSLFIKSDSRMVRIRLSDIIYVEGMSEYLKIHVCGTDSHGKPMRPVITLYSMKKLEERLPSYFKRIHRSYIINLRCIETVSRARVTLQGDISLPIGDLYKKDFLNYLDRNFIGK